MVRAVYNSRGDVLLADGMTLTATYIRKLAALGVSHVYVEDETLNNKAVKRETVKKIKVKDVVARETRSAAVHRIRNILLKSKEAGQLVIEPQPLYSTVTEFTDQLLNNDNLVYNLADLRTQDDYTFEHSVNVCVLALMTGITLGYNREQLTVLGVGALLHDLGKVKIPNEILNKPGKLTQEEFAVIKEHTTYGYQMIRAAGKLGEIPSTIAYQHHEHYDGSGYPLGIKGGEFHEYAQITAIADKFDALTATRVYRPAFPVHEAYQMCAVSGNFWFKERVVKAFLNNVAAYPPGIRVQLNNKMTAEVLDTPKGYALFPRIQVIADENNRPVREPFVISLRDRPDLLIVKVLSDQVYHRQKEYN